MPTVRLALETLRTGNWTVLGVPTATIISALVIVGTLVVLAVRHRPGAADGDRWGDPPEPVVDAEGVVESMRPAEVPVEAPPAGDEIAGEAVTDVDDGLADTTTVVVSDAIGDATDGGNGRPGDGA